MKGLFFLLLVFLVALFAWGKWGQKVLDATGGGTSNFGYSQGDKK